MNVWLIQLGEPLPTDPGRARLLRTGLLAEALAARGHQVTYWTSRFDYRSGRLREGEGAIDSGLGYRIRLLGDQGFERSFSLSRVTFNRTLAALLARNARAAARADGAPDVVVCGYPTPELADQGAALAQEFGARSLVDVRDLWPDVFAHHLPPMLRWPAEVPLAILRARSRRVLRRFDAMVSITEDILQWGLARAGSSARIGPTAVVHHSYPDPRSGGGGEPASHPSIPAIPEDAVLVTYLGGLKPIVDFDTVIEGLELARRVGTERPIHVVFGGTGSEYERFRSVAAGLPDVHVVGWQDMGGIRALMARTDVGLFCYHERFDYRMSIPNKVVEYLAWSKPVLSSVSVGPTADLIAEWKCGAFYPSGSSDILAGLLTRMAANPNELRDMGQRARRAFQERFDPDHTIGRYAKFVESL